MSRWRPDIGFGGFFWIYWIGIPAAVSLLVRTQVPGPVAVLLFLGNAFLAWFLAEVTSAWWGRRKGEPAADSSVLRRFWVGSPLSEKNAPGHRAYRASLACWFLAASFLIGAVYAMTFGQEAPLRRDALILFAFTGVTSATACVLTAYCWWTSTRTRSGHIAADPLEAPTDSDTFAPNAAE